jgi:hypothetical protein
MMNDKYNSAAVLTVKQANDMTPKGRKAIAKWLRKQADYLENFGDEYSARFIARYLYASLEASGRGGYKNK